MNVAAHGPQDADHRRHTAFLLHALGGSARAWTQVGDLLRTTLDTVAVDLPGFGDNAALATHRVEEMADHVVEMVRRARPGRWLLVGHSMGAKVAAVVARRVEDGEPGLAGLSHIVLLAGSPPEPEPMDEDRRSTMRGWFQGDDASSREQAHEFVGQNVASALAGHLYEGAVDDMLRSDRAAWQAWLERGSRDDWSTFVGRLQTPALIVAGGEDGDLGAAAQRRLNAPHYQSARLVVIEGAAHLLPLERPDEVARLIAWHASGGQEPSPDRDYRALIESERVSARTRAALLARLQPDEPDRAPGALASREKLETLRAVLARVVPQGAWPPIDLAARIDKMLACGKGDGWRFADLPPADQAYRAGLATLDAAARSAFGSPFVELSAGQQDALLGRAAEGSLNGGGAPSLSAGQMRHWFEDVRSDAVRTYMAHPATLARIGYGGIANGGDGPRLEGFVLLDAGAREDWEPATALEAQP